MFGCGHILYYMQKYKNLHRYSQQGWEGLNAKIKSIFFQHASKGGGKLTNRNAALHLNAIGLFLIRDLMWRSGLGEEFFMLEYEKIDMEEEHLRQNKDDGKKNKLTTNNIPHLMNFWQLLYCIQ